MDLAQRAGQLTSAVTFDRRKAPEFVAGLRRAFVASRTDAFEAVLEHELRRRLDSLPNRARTGLSRRLAPADAVSQVAEASWQLVLDSIAVLASISTASAVRDVAYWFASDLLKPGEPRTPADSVAAQALVAAAFSVAGTAAPETAVDLGPLASALRALAGVVVVSTTAGTAAQLASVDPCLGHATISRQQSVGPVVDIQVGPSNHFDPHLWQDSLWKRGRARRIDVVTSVFHDHLCRLGQGESSHFDAVNGALLQAEGFGLLDVYAVLADRIRGDEELSDTAPRIIEVTELSDVLAADGRADLRARAIDALTWPAAWDQSWRPWTIVEHRQRLAVRPSLPIDLGGTAAVLVSPAVARAAADVWNDHLAEGNWPLRTFDRGDENGVRLPSRRLSEGVDRLFEEAVAEELIRLGFPKDDVEVNVSTSSRLMGGSAGELPEGDIDVLALDRRGRRLIVLEAKHHDLKIRPADTAALLRNVFISSPRRLCAMERAFRRVGRVQRELASVLSLRNVSTANGWSVVGAVVTPYGSPLAAWLGPADLPVVFVEELAGWLRSLDAAAQAGPG